MKFKMNGVVPPMITPFDEHGNLDELNLIRLVEYLSPRVDGLFICGSYGGGPLMTVEERKRVAEIVRKIAAPDTAIVVHTGTLTTKDTVELSRHAADIGCDAASAVGPYYYHYSEKDLIEYYSQILKATKDFPFYVYHNPQFSGYQTSICVMKALKEQGLSGIKDATFDIMVHARYMRELADENFDIALGTEAMWVSAYAVGSRAFIPGIGNVFPELCRKMWQESMDGMLEASRETQFRINELRDIMYLARSTQLAVYAIAEIKGIVKAYPRAPFIPATDEEKKKIAAALEKLGV
jgi:dihydrodipicolinate synthase/N-acetylneuraminate lyase